MKFTKKYPYSKSQKSMIMTDFICKKCGEVIYHTPMGAYWCKECNSRKEMDEIKR